MKLHKIAKRELKIFKMDEIMIIPPSAESKVSGTYGEINPAIIKDGNIKVSLKKYKNDISNTILYDDMIKEIIILQHLNQYPETSTVNLLGICFDVPRHHCFLVLEPLETDLHKISIKYKFDEKKNKGRFNYREYKIIFYKCLKALNAIHSLGFIHNDIKLPNIMLNGTDIKFIDFGLSKYLGISPLKKQVNSYITTDVIQAPEKRISFSTDIFSLASSMIHLTIRNYGKIFINKKGEISDQDESLHTYLGMERVFGPDGLDLLLKLLVPNPENRWCANTALQHSYFNEIRDQNAEIDRTVVGLLGGNPIVGLMQQVDYNVRNFEHKNMELCYYDELYINYIDNICPIQLIENDIDKYHTLMDWILHKFNDSVEYVQLFYGIDVIINGIIATKNNFIKNQQKTPNGVDNTRKDATFNMLLFSDIFTDGRLDFEFMLKHKGDSTSLISYFYQNLNINIDLLPISVHISYIYLQLKFDIQKFKTLTFESKFFQDICLHLIFWFIQPIPYDEQVTTLELVIFTTIKLLSKIGNVSGIELIQNPIIPILTMDEQKYQKMLDYFYHQYMAIDLKKYSDYTIYFDDPLFLSDEFTRHSTEYSTFRGIPSKQYETKIESSAAIDTEPHRGNVHQIHGEKYLGFSASQAVSDPSEQLLSMFHDSSASSTAVQVADVSSVCRVDDTSCRALYESIPWKRLNDMPGSCSEAAAILEKLKQLKRLQEKPTGLTNIWIKNLEERIRLCRN